MKHSKIYLIILLLIIFIYISPVSGEIVKKPTTYRILVDQYHGFYRIYEVYNKSLGRTINYQNGTLNINKGDTIIWINDAVPDTKLIIINQQKLWGNNSGELKWAYKQFNYTFDKSGLYDVYIKGHSKSQFRQQIIVGRPLEYTNINKKSINVSKNVNSTTKENLNNSSKTKTKVLNLTNKSNISKNDKGEIKLTMVLSPILLVAILSTIHILKRKR